MIKKSHLLYGTLFCVTGGFVFDGCIEPKQAATPSIEILSSDTIVHLMGDAQAPACKISIEYAYLKSAEKNDSITGVISHTLQTAAFGPKYGNLSPEAAVEAFRKSYATQYIKDVEPIYKADLKRTKKEDLPSWYNYEYSFTSDLRKGKEGIWNYSTTIFEYTGGAHPNTWIKLVNVDEHTGQILKKEQVFAAGTDNEICALLIPKLMEFANDRLETDTISSIEGLQDVGINTELYIPDNFLLSDDGVSFLYNPYEIAPYSMGSITLTLPYEDISTYLIK